MMERREFIALLGGAAAAWPLAARGQQDGRVRRLGVMMSLAESDSHQQELMGGFLRGMRDLGWTEGRNFRIDYRATEGRSDAIRQRASELVALNPDVLLVGITSNVQEVQRQTRTIPIVFVNIPDPLDTGVVTNIARPGGNTTGFMNWEPSMGGKWLELLKEIAPAINRVLVLVNADNAGNDGLLRLTQGSAAALGLQVSPAPIRGQADIERAIDSFADRSNAGILVLPGPIIQQHRQLIFLLAARHRLPAVYSVRYYAADGGLMAYGANDLDIYRRAASYVDRILKGEKPADLPVQAPTKFELVVNLKAAKAIGLTIPEAFLLRADEVIE